MKDVTASFVATPLKTPQTKFDVIPLKFVGGDTLWMKSTLP